MIYIERYIDILIDGFYMCRYRKIDKELDICVDIERVINKWIYRKIDGRPFKCYRGLLVEEPEGLLEFSPHGLRVGVLHQELGAQLTT